MAQNASKRVNTADILHTFRVQVGFKAEMPSVASESRLPDVMPHKP